jgi:hypothetical protein
MLVVTDHDFVILGSYVFPYLLAGMTEVLRIIKIRIWYICPDRKQKVIRAHWHGTIDGRLAFARLVIITDIWTPPDNRCDGLVALAFPVVGNNPGDLNHARRVH